MQYIAVGTHIMYIICICKYMYIHVGARLTIPSNIF